MGVFVTCPECGFDQRLTDTSCETCGRPFDPFLSSGPELEGLVEMLVSDKERNWKILAKNAEDCYLITTLEPVFLDVRGPLCEWECSEVRAQLNTSFLASLPDPISTQLSTIIYMPHARSQRTENNSDESPVSDKVILLDSFEADIIRAYKPHDCSQEIWDGKNFIVSEIPCTNGMRFNMRGIGESGLMAIREWARSQLESSSWTDWVLLRDGDFFHPEGDRNLLYVPNGLHPVICLDWRRYRRREDYPVSLASFLYIDQGRSRLLVEEKTARMRFQGALANNEFVISDRKSRGPSSKTAEELQRLRQQKQALIKNDDSIPF